MAYFFRCLSLLISLLFLAACGVPPGEGPRPALRADVLSLTDSIQALGEDVDPGEAARAAEIALSYTYQLAQSYEITDSPLVHNIKVNRGIKPRGLCWHWAEDLEARLKAENFTTLELHRAIANADSPILIDHSTAIISANGADMYDGLVLDPWRKGGQLHWVGVREDTRYTWYPRLEVLKKHGRIRYASGGAVVTWAGEI
ncbi:MAG: hypothetical protein AAGA12_01850 [Pseudomonadota bacterium]